MTNYTFTNQFKPKNYLIKINQHEALLKKKNKKKINIKNIKFI